tara:strand:+ start:1273 stop:2448 length:1176 start_codon:yes stop_codon:yes gene_type:complete
MLNLFIRDLKGKTFSLYKIDLKTQVSKLKTEIEKICKIPIDQQRLLWAGKQLEDEKTLEYYNIYNEATIHMVLRLRGMISVPKPEHENDEVGKFLMNPEINPPPSNRMLSELQKKINANNHIDFLLEHSRNNILNQAQKKVLINITDTIYNCNQSDDIKVTFQNDKYALNALFGIDNGARIYRQLTSLHSINYPDEKKIVLRRMQGPSSGCIHFHRDGPYATKTVQMTLNNDNEYLGGRLCFFTYDQLKIPERKSGSITIHQSSVMHAVTRMIDGCRYSLFVVDRNNRLGERNVFQLSNIEIDTLMSIKNEVTPISITPESEKIDVPQLTWSSEKIIYWLKTTINIKNQETLDNFREIDGFKLLIMSQLTIQSLKVSQDNAIKIFKIIHEN